MLTWTLKCKSTTTHYSDFFVRYRKAVNEFHFKDKVGEKFKIRAVFEEREGAGLASFYLERDFE